MKHIKLFEEINENKKSEYNSKIRDLKLKSKETGIKIDSIKKKARDEKDPIKQEILILTMQKLAMKQEQLKIDVEINKLKRSIL